MRLDEQSEMLEDAIRATSQYNEIPEAYIEKDYWITKMLYQLSRSTYSNNVVFKGGTSLSKGFGIINRFSEDIDIAVLSEDLSGNQVKNLMSRVSKEMAWGFKEDANAEGVSKGSRYRKSFYIYPVKFKSTSSNFLSNRVVVEINSFANPYPFKKRVVRSFITSYLEIKGMVDLIERYEMYPFELNVLDKSRTLCEKTVSLIRYSFTENPVEGLASKIRHFYDIYYLLNDQDCDFYVSDQFIPDLVDLIEHDKQTFDKPTNWPISDVCNSPLFKFFPETWKELSPLYEKELSALSFGEIPSSSQIQDCFSKFLESVKNRLIELRK